MVFEPFLMTFLSTLPFRFARTRKARVEPKLKCEFLEMVLMSSHEPNGSFSIALFALATSLGLVIVAQPIKYLPIFPQILTVV